MPEFNLKIDYEAEDYGHDGWLINCKVTYPTRPKPITIDYHHWTDDGPEKALERMFKDVRGYIEDPADWLNDYITNRSSDLGMQLEAAWHSVDYYQSQVTSALQSAATCQKCLEEAQQKLGELQKRKE